MRGRVHPAAWSIVLSAALAVVLLPAAWADDAPPLPAGLGEDEKQSEAPPLPSGLGGEKKESGAPSLPPGLGRDKQDAPALPAGLGGEAETPGETREEKPRLQDRLPEWIHGFVETRGGMRLMEDHAQPADATIGELRLQLEGEKIWDSAILEIRGDFYVDGVLEDAEFDLRQFRLSWRPLDAVDLRVGRQVLTWGTGDLLFINDMFPKDWESFFIGRDVEYLKAPSDAIKLGWYSDWANVEFVYTPQFNHDRFITGERISYYAPIFGLSGKHRQADYNAPSTWFEDDEFAMRVYRRVGRYEIAAYGYSGYWKTPGGQRLIPLFQGSFPKLGVYGASLRGPLGKGIFNVEMGYFDSRQDRGGGNVFVNNSEFRFLVGYEQELAKEFTGAVQYYVEHMMGYSAYENSLLFFMPKRDQDRHVVTLRLTKLLMNQELTLSLFAYYSPSDKDAYIRPRASYKITDNWLAECGANLFVGESDTTFFGQFEKNTNVYLAMRFTF